MALVLCLGSDDRLIQKRKRVMEQAGHTIITVKDLREIGRVCGTHTVDVAVIGQSVPPAEKRRIAVVLQQECTRTRLLELYKSGSMRVLESADDWLEISSGDEAELSDRVAALAVTRKRKVARKGKF